MLLADSFHERFQVLWIGLSPLLIAYGKELHVKWFWMPHLCTHFSPLRIHTAIGELNEVKGILDIRIEFCYWHMSTLIIILELAGKAHTDNWQRLSTYLFRE